MDSYKKIVAVAYLLLFFNTVKSQQMVIEKSGIGDGVMFYHHNHYDNHTILSGSKQITKINASMNDLWRFEIFNDKTNLLDNSWPHESGMYVVAHQTVTNNSGVILETYPYIVSLNNCLEPIWHKKLIYNQIFNDTVVNLNVMGYSEVPRITQVWTDKMENVYIVTLHENRRVIQITDDTLSSNISYIYKFSKLGELLYRKVLIPKVHYSSYLIFQEWVNGNMVFSGMAYYKREGAIRNDRRVYRRAVLISLDTSCNIVSYKDYNEDDYYTSGIHDIKYQPSSKEYFAMINGSRYDTATFTMHSELNLIKLDTSFQETKRVTFNSRTSNINFIANTLSFDTIGNIITHITKEFQDENSKPELRTQHTYFAKFDSSWNIIDSVKVGFLKYTNNNDTLYNIIGVRHNPNNANSKIYIGYRRLGLLAPIRSIIFKLNTSTLELDSINYPVEQNDWKCTNELRGTITKTVYIHDTITINRRINATYNTWIGLNNYLQPIDINLSPNPATTQVHIESPIKIESYILNNTSGTSVQGGELDAENNIDVSQLPQGIYFLQLQLVNGQRVVKKLVRSF